MSEEEKSADNVQKFDKMDTASLYSSDIKTSDLALPTSLLDSVPRHVNTDNVTADGEIIESPTVGETLTIKHSSHN